MSKPKFRNPDLVQLQPWRTWARVVCPTPREGFVLEDLDFVFLRFSELENRPYNHDGRFAMADIKQGDRWLTYAQRRLFGLMDNLFHQAGEGGKFYVGFYVIQWHSTARLKTLWRDQVQNLVEGTIRRESFLDRLKPYYRGTYVSVNNWKDFKLSGHPNCAYEELPLWKHFLLGRCNVPPLEATRVKSETILESKEAYLKRIEQ